MAEPMLIDRLTAAAAAALEDLGPTIEHEPGRLQFVTIELGLANGGLVVDVVVRTQRRAGVGRSQDDARRPTAEEV